MADSTVPPSLPCGLINAANRYLSAEPFRFQVVATGLVLRLRQVWMLRFVPSQGAGAAGQAEESGQRLHLLSWLQRFLAADPNGKVTCDQESPGPGALFLLRQYPDGKVCKLHPPRTLHCPPPQAPAPLTPGPPPTAAAPEGKV
ncbi:fascin-like [Trachemys scripta elegans]|uniref:fascin-like n=1 Tax=Trachemys scripta elegans TaxID=31138 RepID=UPI0015567E38|nr:fascin-like [Trachemys scripta elegans]XP_053882596.1 fascin-like [Malaclemys terrapin pileata]